MRLNKLVIRNFLSVQDATLYLGDKGLVSIEGDNQDKTGSDSNGSGKSSIINAILWCLYGNYGKDEAADDVVNSIAGKDCMVQCEWQDDKGAYRITRYRKHGKHKNAVRVELATAICDSTNEFVWSDFTKAGAQAVQEQINTIMGASENVFRASCFAQQEDSIDIPGMTDKELKALLESVLPLDDLGAPYKKAQANVTAQKAIVEKLNSEIQLKTWQIDENKKQLKLALDARKNYIDEVDAKNADIDKQIKLKNIARGVALSMSNKGTLEADIAELESRISLIGYSDHHMASYKHNEAEKKVSQLWKQLKKPDNTCRACGQEVEDLEEVTARLKIQLEDAEIERDKLRDAAKVAAHNHSQKTTLTTEMKELEAQLAEANRNADAAARLKAEISLLEGQKAPAGSNPHQAAVTRHRDALKAALTGKEDFEAQHKEALERLGLLQAVELTYSPKGVRYHILEKVAPKLTEDTNKYLEILTDGAIKAVWSTVTKTGAGEFREKFSIEAQMEGRSKFGLLSGGEKRKVRLACFFALQDLIAAQATKNISLWCGDEIDHALDGAGMERLMGLLNEKTKTKSTILVISHNELQEWIPNHAVVTRKDGVSTITGYLNAP